MAGLVALAVVVSVLTQGRVDRYFWITVQQPLERLLAVCTKVLAGWSVLALGVLLPVYINGSNYFGESWLFTPVHMP